MTTNINSGFMTPEQIIGNTESGSSDSRGAMLTAGPGAIDLTDKANGSLHMRHDGLPQIKFGGAARQLGFAEHAVDCRMSNLVAASITRYRTYMPVKGRVTGISRAYATAPASAGGIVVADVQLAGTSILASAAESDEGLSANTLTAHSICTNTELLAFNAGATLDIAINANNADMTGGGVPNYFIYFENA
jgi:hypothetical protein